MNTSPTFLQLFCACRLLFVRTTHVRVIRFHNQGSVLGPLLFIMFVNDVPSVVSSPVFMFADDTKIFRVIRNHDELYYTPR